MLNRAETAIVINQQSSIILNEKLIEKIQENNPNFACLEIEKVDYPHKKLDLLYSSYLNAIYENPYIKRIVIKDITHPDHFLVALPMLGAETQKRQISLSLVGITPKTLRKLKEYIRNLSESFSKENFFPQLTELTLIDISPSAITIICEAFSYFPNLKTFHLIEALPKSLHAFLMNAPAVMETLKISKQYNATSVDALKKFASVSPVSVNVSETISSAEKLIFDLIEQQKNIENVRDDLRQGYQQNIDIFRQQITKCFLEKYKINKLISNKRKLAVTVDENNNEKKTKNNNTENNNINEYSFATNDELMQLPESTPVERENTFLLPNQFTFFSTSNNNVTNVLSNENDTVVRKSY